MPGRSDRGVVTSIRGSVVDVRFDGPSPPILSVLRAGENNAVVIEVLTQRDAHHVRGVALTTTEGLGVNWRPVHRAPPALARRSTTSQVFETGIKVIDVLTPWNAAARPVFSAAQAWARRCC